MGIFVKRKTKISEKIEDLNRTDGQRDSYSILRCKIKKLSHDIMTHFLFFGCSSFSLFLILFDDIFMHDRLKEDR